jgi:hypothetical protein
MHDTITTCDELVAFLKLTKAVFTQRTAVFAKTAQTGTPAELSRMLGWELLRLAQVTVSAEKADFILATIAQFPDKEDSEVLAMVRKIAFNGMTVARSLTSRNSNRSFDVMEDAVQIFYTDLYKRLSGM